MESISSFFENITSGISQIVEANQGLGTLYTAVVRWGFVVLALYILIRSIRSLLATKNPSEVWAYVQINGVDNYPVTHWENVLGRAKSSDIQLYDDTVSRNHGTLTRDSKGKWTYKDLGSKNGSFVNGELVIDSCQVEPGDEIQLGDCKVGLIPISLEEKRNNIELRRHDTKPISPWASLVALTVFQILTIIQFSIAMGDEMTPWIPIAFSCLAIVMWVYVLVFKGMRRRGYEMEIIAFFLSTLSLAVTASAYPEAVMKQLIAVVLGIVAMIGICILLRNLELMKKARNALAIAAVALLIFNLVFGTLKNGADNWVYIGGVSLQPSELVKLVFIAIGSASLDELFEKKNLTYFMVFSVICLGCLAVMGDFGTAMIFFVTFVVMAFLRSGDFSKLVLIVGVALAGGLLLLRFKAHIAERFAAWGHVWEYANDAGFQQTRTMSATASGGLVGVGAGKGWLTDVFASDTDLVFGVVAEEWGLIIAILTICCIITLALFSVISIMAGRSTYYTIAACGAMTMLVFQTILNVFGSLDLIPLTGVTFPFVSNGGTSMIASWGLLGFLKAADTRQNASIAVTGTDKAMGGEEQ